MVNYVSLDKTKDHQIPEIDWVDHGHGGPTN